MKVSPINVRVKAELRVPNPSNLETLLAQQIAWAKLPPATTQFKAIPGRQFRWDLAWPDRMLLVEVQGGVWFRAGHTSGIGVNRDCMKLNLATLAGYRCFQVTSNQVKDGSALKWIQEALRVAP